MRNWLSALGGVLCCIVATAQDGGVVPQKLADDVSVCRLANGVWLHTTDFTLPEFGRVAANGLVVVDGGEAVVIDLPWTDEQTRILFNWIERDLHAKVKTVVPTHSHQDCSGGLDEAHRRGADSFALDQTADLLRKARKPSPRYTFHDAASVECGRARVELTHLGGGHAVDNIIAWLPAQRILFGGCLIKAASAKDLGNTADGDLKAYPETLRKAKSRYADAAIVVPGHGAPGGLELIDHTLVLCGKTAPQP